MGSETVAFHCGITLVSASFLKLEDILHKHKSEPTHKKSNVREELRYTTIRTLLVVTLELIFFIYEIISHTLDPHLFVSNEAISFTPFGSMEAIINVLQ